MNNNNDNDIISVQTSEIRPDDEKDFRCAPSKKFENGSCIPLNLLIEMAKAYNDEYNDKIRLNSTIEILNPGKYKKYLLSQFKKRLDKVCDNQRCWVKQKFIKKLNPKIKQDLESNTFRPKGPHGKFTWLNTNNVNNTMIQYENKYKDFKFLGAVPIDFDELPIYGLSNLNFKNLIDKGVSKIGVVFNLDEHYKSGSHWTALFADLLKGNVYYYDSYGIEPEERIVIFMRRIAKFIKNELKIFPTVDYNRLRNQYGNSECGLYSISFIARMLRDGDFKKVTNVVIKDNEINECRKIYFT